MALTTEEVRKIGLISRLELSDAEVEGLKGELNTILDYVGQMQELDLDGVEPTTHSTALADSLRGDVAVPSLSQEAVLMNAPEARNGAFIVPRIKAPGQSEEGSA
ncbi:MAG: Asp-tRNA(Asn)/Glu-tRNA(Gln) amidotransferase subunit GatC [Coriobacteriia bacterium]|nr:Asp-tRNA(Asn)/Glu-tRNA(Gln) amidotransferase subunit GatC [Coriobacteriia bacterium]MCL2537024.1 Asp-tRNA(Asn)/Glu-tRNA(Gln) amidotransferase subunit GatC [Coriobacteriia bacterium]